MEPDSTIEDRTRTAELEGERAPEDGGSEASAEAASSAGFDVSSAVPNMGLRAAPMVTRLGRYRARLAQIAVWEPRLREETNQELKKHSLSLRYRARSGESLKNLLPEAFALVREAARRANQMRHFEVQMIGGMAMFDGCIAEMQTGEGKTLTATLPMYLRALTGKGTHLATVNDYLAKRDADLMGPVYRMLGMTIGAIQTEMNQDQRREAYNCDLTYGTSKEFGFDFLRDRLLIRRTRETATATAGDGAEIEKPVQRGSHFCLVDEADSILIDEARTPLIISAIPGEAEQMAVACYQWAASMVDRFHEDEHYDYDYEKKTCELNFEGRQLTRILPKPKEMGPVGLVDAYQYIERAVKVSREFHNHRQYVVHEGEIVIVDEFSGRMAEGRKWSGGLHQAVEAQEGVEVTVETGHAARVTVQDLFKRYEHLCGMTGTASSSAGELKKIYTTPVLQIPTNRPPQRKILPPQIYATAEDKWAAITRLVASEHANGRPILIGTRSIDKSERLSHHLREAKIPHAILNARHIAAEAEIVAKAGEVGHVTVATNMAGRGTDIKLQEGVAELGGLFVIGTEVHDSMRIDRQLVGRCGRQGDPGAFQQFLAMDDEILSLAFGPEKAEKLAKSAAAQDGRVRMGPAIFRRAQRKIEKRHFRGRRVLLYHEKNRKKMHVEMGQDPYLDMPDQ